MDYFPLKTFLKVSDRISQERGIMKGIRPKFSIKSWKKLLTVFQQKNPVSLKKLAGELKQSEDETMSFVKQVFAKTPMKTLKKDDGIWLDKGIDIENRSLPLTSAEWILLQQLLSQHDQEGLSSLDELAKKVMDLSPVKIDLELLHEISAWDEQFDGSLKELARKLDTTIADRKMAKIIKNDEKEHVVFPQKILHLEGSLCLIAEDENDHSLISFHLNEIHSIEILLSKKVQQKTNFEIEEFIAALRSMGDKETRLILKIHNPEEVNLFPEHHFLGKPCMITNSNGDLIWAAYVEPCEALFEWLSMLGKSVEILDPLRFKQEYLAYCEEKLRKIA